jgi:hypothetical protein
VHMGFDKKEGSKMLNSSFSLYNAVYYFLWLEEIESLVAMGYERKDVEEAYRNSNGSRTQTMKILSRISSGECIDDKGTESIQSPDLKQQNEDDDDTIELSEDTVQECRNYESLPIVNEKLGEIRDIENFGIECEVDSSASKATDAKLYDVKHQMREFEEDKTALDMSRPIVLLGESGSGKRYMQLFRLFFNYLIIYVYYLLQLGDE